MQVKWAEDVYDPPATSMSHTLRNNKPKKSKKDDHKHKHKKKKKKPAREKQALPNRFADPLYLLPSLYFLSLNVSMQQSECTRDWE